MKLSLNLDKRTLSQAQKVFNNLGLDVNSAVKLFLQQSARDNAFPFTPKSGPRSLDKANHRAEKLYDYIQRVTSPAMVLAHVTNQRLCKIFLHVKNEIHLMYNELPAKDQKEIQNDVKIAKTPGEMVFDDYKALAMQYCCELYARRNHYPLYTGVEVLHKKDPLKVTSGSVLSGKPVLKSRMKIQINHHIIKNCLYKIAPADPKKHARARYTLADKKAFANILYDFIE